MTDRCSNTHSIQRCLSSPKIPDRPWSSPNPLFKGYWWFFMWGSYLYLVPSTITQWLHTQPHTRTSSFHVYVLGSEVLSVLRISRHLYKHCGRRPSASSCPSICRVHRPSYPSVRLSVVSVRNVSDRFKFDGFQWKFAPWPFSVLCLPQSNFV